MVALKEKWPRNNCQGARDQKYVQNLILLTCLVDQTISSDSISSDVVREHQKGYRTKKKVVRKNYKAMFNYHTKH